MNDNDPVFTNLPTTHAISEDSAVGITVFSILVTDDDEGTNGLENVIIIINL